jgi:Sec-independent protein translocase protein TatA
LRGAKAGAATKDFKSKLHEDDEAPDKTLRIKSNEDDPEKKIKNLKKVFINL